MACLKTNFDDWFGETMTKVRQLRSDVSNDKEEIKNRENKFHEKLNNVQKHFVSTQVCVFIGSQKISQHIPMSN